MKRLFILLAVLAMVAPAWAGLVDVVAETYQDNDSSGTLTAGDVVPIKIVTSVIISTIDLSLAVTGPGELAESPGGIAHHSDFLIWNQSSPLIAGNAIAALQGGALPDLAPGPGSTIDMVTGLEVTVTGEGVITVDITAGGGGLYKNEVSDPGYTVLTSGDLGDLIIGGGPSRIVAVRVAGLGGTVTMDPEGDSFPEGTVIALTAVPDAGYRVRRWRGADSNLLTNDNTLTVSRRNNVILLFERIPEDNVRKALFTANRRGENPADGFVILGTLSANQSDFLSADTITIQLLNSEDVPLVDEVLDTSDENAFRILNNQLGFTYHTLGGPIKRMNFRLGSGVFVLMGAGLDLTNLSPPVTLHIAFGDYDASGELDETLINGPRRSIPMEYFDGVSDILIVNRMSGRTVADLVTGVVTGSLALDEEASMVDLSDATTEVTITISDFEETIPAPGGSFIRRGNRYVYRRPRGADTDTYKITQVLIDFNRHIFTARVQQASIAEGDEVDFGISITIDAATVFDETTTVETD